MSNIRINKIHNLQAQKINQKAKKEEQEQVLNQKPELTRKDASEVLNYMENAGALNKAQVKSGKKIDVSKYVDKESASRIETVVKAFEQTILKSAEIAIGEFGLSENDSQDVAIMAFNQKFLV